MKILISAYGCEPDRGSEPWLGWNWSKQIARFHEVWVLTRANNKEVIESSDITSKYPNLHFLYFDLPSWLTFWKKGARGLQLYYYLWQIGAFFFIKKIYKNQKFDLIHHITFGGNWRPIFLSLLPIPFIWGPTGSEGTPFIFWLNLPLKEKLYETLRFLMRFYGLRIDPFVRLTLKRSKIILDSNSKWVKLSYPDKYKYKVIKFFQNGINIQDYPASLLRNKPNERVKILLASKLVHWKGVYLSAQAFVAYAKQDNKGDLIIIGNGPYKEKIENLFFKEKLLDRITFLGSLKFDDFINILKNGDIFLFTPFHHGQATAVLQAMASGLPIIGIDCDTIAETVTSDCGIFITPKKVSQCVDNLAKAIHLLVNNEQKRVDLGKSSRKRVETIFDWNKRGEELENIYMKILYKNIE